MTRLFLIGMGSNIGDRKQHLLQALDQLSAMNAGCAGTSRVYETAHMRLPDDTREYPPHLNCAAAFRSSLNPAEMLDVLHDLEDAAGRERSIRWGSRTLDLDILLIEGMRIHTSRLQVPHPRMWERRFVLEPLLDLVDGSGNPLRAKLVSALRRVESSSQPVQVTPICLPGAHSLPVDGRIFPA